MKLNSNPIIAEAYARMIEGGLVEKHDKGIRITEKGTAHLAEKTQPKPQPVLSETLKRGA
jgi:Mn-dependent DtxR family transcriptional regulator